jgi:hypothetical protein
MEQHGREVTYGSTFEQTADDAGDNHDRSTQWGNSAEHQESECEQEIFSNSSHLVGLLKGCGENEPAGC